MKKYLLPENGSFYKANLHCHTTISDGRMTPEEVKNAYKEQGYSIVAYTDHDVFIPHPELCEDGFLALNGFEVEIFLPEWKKYGRAAGPVRNKEMVNSADLVIAFWDGKSKGTKSLIKYAEKIGKELIKIDI